MLLVRLLNHQYAFYERIFQQNNGLNFQTSHSQDQTFHPLPQSHSSIYISKSNSIVRYFFIIWTAEAGQIPSSIHICVFVISSSHLPVPQAHTLHLLPRISHRVLSLPLYAMCPPVSAPSDFL